MARIVSLSVLIAAIAGLGIMFFQVIAPFLLPLFLAAVAAVLLTPSFEDMRKRFKGRTRTAAGVTTLLAMLLVLLPLSTGVIVGGLQAYSFSAQISPTEFQEKRDDAVDYLARFLAPRSDWLPSGVQPPTEDEVEPQIAINNESIAALQEIRGQGGLNLDDISEVTRRIRFLQSKNQRLRQLEHTDDGKVVYFRSLLNDNVVRIRQSFDGQLFGVASKTVGGTLGIVGQTLGVVVGAIVTLFIFAVALYYFLADGPDLLLGAESLIPVHVDYQRELLTEFAKVVRSVVLATFLAATAQGIATTVALWLVGFDHLILLLILAIVASLIPLAGTWLVWVPCALLLIIKGHWGLAVGLSLWGSVVVGTMDNVIRAYVLNNDTKLHPLLALLAVLGGLQVMGIWGVFIGPIIASCLHALVKIFNHELLELSHEKFGEIEPNSAPSASSLASGVADAKKPTDDTPHDDNAADKASQESEHDNPQADLASNKSAKTGDREQPANTKAGDDKAKS